MGNEVGQNGEKMNALDSSDHHCLDLKMLLGRSRDLGKKKTRLVSRSLIARRVVECLVLSGRGVISRRIR